MLVEGCVRGFGGECPSPPTWGTCVPLLVLAFVSCLFCWGVSGVPEQRPPLCHLQACSLQLSRRAQPGFLISFLLGVWV